MSTSVVMPVHGNWPVVERALDALDDSVQVVVVDDGSPDDTGDRLETRGRITLLRNTTSVGFGAACNRGAETATNRYVCFLNSDAIVEADAFARLEAVLERTEDAGAAVPMLLNADGSLQEAGSAVGGDGTTYPLGAGRQPDDPNWAFSREVDYGSAACLLVRRDAFAEVGGFDTSYLPAYYEDADLCFRLAQRGLRTILEPSARVLHLGYGSGSLQRARQLVARNRRTFLERWSERLGHRPIVSGAKPWPHRLLALRDAIALTRFLVVDNVLVAQEVARRWPRARVTLLGSGSADGIEKAEPDDVERWLEERRFHYSAVIGADEGMEQALRRTQPQAVRTLDDPALPPPGQEPRG